MIYDEQRVSFENYKSNVCHRAKDIGAKAFIIEVLTSDVINRLYELKWYAECLYLLAMLDYISRINNVPICTKYNKLRHSKLDSIIYPESAYLFAKATNNPAFLEECFQDSIPEFKRFNIVENEVESIA